MFLLITFVITGINLIKIQKQQSLILQYMDRILKARTTMASKPATKIEIFYDVVSPYAWLGFEVCMDFSYHRTPFKLYSVICICVCLSYLFALDTCRYDIILIKLVFYLYRTFCLMNVVTSWWHYVKCHWTVLCIYMYM